MEATSGLTGLVMGSLGHEVQINDDSRKRTIASEEVSGVHFFARSHRHIRLALSLVASPSCSAHVPPLPSEESASHSTRTAFELETILQ